MLCLCVLKKDIRRRCFEKLKRPQLFSPTWHLCAPPWHCPCAHGWRARTARSLAASWKGSGQPSWLKDRPSEVLEKEKDGFVSRWQTHQDLFTYFHQQKNCNNSLGLFESRQTSYAEAKFVEAEAIVDVNVHLLKEIKWGNGFRPFKLARNVPNLGLVHSRKLLSLIGLRRVWQNQALRGFNLLATANSWCPAWQRAGQEQLFPLAPRSGRLQTGWSRTHRRCPGWWHHPGHSS